MKDKILSEEGHRQQAKLTQLQAAAERLGCTLPQLAIGNARLRLVQQTRRRTAASFTFVSCPQPGV